MPVVRFGNIQATIPTIDSSEDSAILLVRFRESHNNSFARLDFQKRMFIDSLPVKLQHESKAVAVKLSKRARSSAKKK